jgi:hypothetical protein
MSIANSYEVQIDVESFGIYNKLVEVLKNFEEELLTYHLSTSDGSGWKQTKKRVKLWLTNDKPMGTSDLMRSELVVRYGAQ